MEQQTFDKLLEKLVCQFLCWYPVKCIEWQPILKNITWEQQLQLVKKTCMHEANERHHVNLDYELNFLKKLLFELEKMNEEVHDIIYEHLCDLQLRIAPNSQKKYAFKHYVLPAYNAILSFRESKSIVAEGTTGLCSWPASLALTDYLLHHSEIVHDKSVLELGAGIGLCGLMLTICCAPKCVLLTDGSEDCVNSIRENIIRNFQSGHEFQKIVSVYEVKWKTIDAANLPDPSKLNVLLAADVVYDESVFDDLAHAIEYVFNSTKNKIKMLLAATVRNEQTLNAFLNLLDERNFHVKEQDVIAEAQSNLHWDRSTPVKIFLITRNQQLD